MFCALRDAPGTDEMTKGVIGDFLLNRHYPSPDDLKLVPTQADRSTYDALVKQHDLAPFEGSGIINAYRYFKKQLAGKDDNDQPLVPATILQAIQQSLQVVMINLSAEDDPYLIFESLNHKGKPLSESDLVRNYVLMRFQHSITSGGEQESVYQQLWCPMETALGERLSDFLRHYGMRRGENIRKGEVYSGFKREYSALASSDNVKTTLLETKQAALAYEKFLRPELENDNHIADRLQQMVDLDSTVFYPLLIRVYRAWQKEEIEGSVVVSFLDHLESFYVRRSVCGVPTNALNKLTLEWCLHLPDEAQDRWLLERLKAGAGGRKWPTDIEFKQALIHGQLYPRRRIAKYLLDQLEESFGHKERVELTSASIEHVLPQTLTEDWVASLGPDYERIRGTWGDTLGNLTLTGYNPELSNLPFDQKKPILENSHYELNRSVIIHEHWTSIEIEARANVLADLAMARWNRPDAL
jgi:hypothetical protein